MMAATKKTPNAKGRSRSSSLADSPSQTPTRGRSPGPSPARLAAQQEQQRSPSADGASNADVSTASQPGASASGPRPSKRKRRSELSPSSKANHSTVEKERREAMNERFGELAALIPQLQEAAAQGKKPTKGEIVKASINYHLQQEKRLQHLSRQLELLAQHSTASNVSAAAIGTELPQLAPAFIPSHCTTPSPPATADSQSHNARLSQLLEQASTNDQGSDAGSTPRTDAGVAEPPTPFKGGVAMVQQWSLPAFSTGWSAPAGLAAPSFFGNDGPKDMLSAFNLAGLSQDQILPTSSFSSPTHSIHQYRHSHVTGEPHAGFGAESLLAQRSLSETDTMSLFSSHSSLDGRGHMGRSASTGARSSNSDAGAYTHRPEPPSLALSAGSEGTMDLLRDAPSGGDFAFLPDNADFLSSAFGLERGSQPLMLADERGKDISAMLPMEGSEDTVRAFPTLLRTEKPAVTQKR